MEKNKIVKILSILLVGVIAFLIDNSSVYADDWPEQLCSYEFDWGTLDFVKSQASFNGVPAVVAWVSSNDNCGSDDNPCINEDKTEFESTTKLGYIDTSKWTMNMNSETGEYSCPPVYYDFSDTYKGFGFWNNKKYVDLIFSPEPTSKYHEEDAEKREIFSSINSGFDQSVCDDALAKLNEAEAKLATFRQRVGATQSALNTTDAYSILDSESRFESAYNSAVEAEKEFNEAYAYYVVAYEEAGKMGGCNGLTDPSNLKSQYDSLAEALISYKNAFDEEVARAKEEHPELAEELEEVKKNVDDKIDDFEDLYETFEKRRVSWGHINANEDKEMDCSELIGENVRKDIKQIMLWIRIAVPILLIVLGSLDFAKAVLADDPKALGKATSTFTKRAIAAVAVFFVPSIIMFLINSVNELSKSCNVKELTEGVIIWKI